jgi:2-methylcitrate dehydratase PrpD
LRTQSRLAAMFSLDYLVAAVAVLGDSGPRATDADTRSDPTVLRLAERVTVRVAPDLQARMPLDRGARLSVQLDGADSLVVEVPNARWDPRHEPASWLDVLGKARSLLEPVGIDAGALADWVLSSAASDGPLLDLAPVTTPAALDDAVPTELDHQPLPTPTV